MKLAKCIIRFTLMTIVLVTFIAPVAPAENMMVLDSSSEGVLELPISTVTMHIADCLPNLYSTQPLILNQITSISIDNDHNIILSYLQAADNMDTDCHWNITYSNTTYPKIINWNIPTLAMFEDKISATAYLNTPEELQAAAQKSLFDLLYSINSDFDYTDLVFEDIRVDSDSYRTFRERCEQQGTENLYTRNPYGKVYFYFHAPFSSSAYTENDLICATWDSLLNAIVCWENLSL